MSSQSGNMISKKLKGHHAQKTLNYLLFQKKNLIADLSSSPSSLVKEEDAPKIFQVLASSDGRIL